MTHTLTHTGKGLYGNNGAKSAADLILLEQKWSESLENQGPEGSQSVGKEQIQQYGYTVDTVRQTIQKNFAAKGLSCVSNGEKCPL